MAGRLEKGAEVTLAMVMLGGRLPSWGVSLALDEEGAVDEGGWLGCCGCRLKGEEVEPGRDCCKASVGVAMSGDAAMASTVFNRFVGRSGL